MRQLLYYRAIRDAFFPDSILDASELRSQLSGTGQYSDAELDAVTSANLDEYVKRLSDRDARFDYQVTFFPRDTDGRLFPPKLLASITRPDRRVDVLVRDEEAVRLDPPRVIFGTSGEATKQLRHAIETGTQAEVLVSNFQSAFDFIAPPPSEPQLLLIQPRPPSPDPVYLNVTFGAGTSAVAYEELEFRRKRIGTKEVELETVKATLPFTFSMVLRMGDQLSATFSFEERFEDKDIRSIRKFVNAFAELKKTGFLEVEDAQRNAKLFSGTTDAKGFPEPHERFKTIVDDLCEIAERFGLRLSMPHAIDRETVDSIPMLLELARTGRSEVGVSNLSVTISKIMDGEGLMAGLDSERSFKFDLQQFSVPGRILGKEVEIGPCSIVCARVVVKNGEDVRRRYLAAKEGDGIVLEIEALLPAQILMGAEQFGEATARVPNAARPGAPAITGTVGLS